jgi:cyclic beta-1,2-glucan synthetase
MAADVYAEPPHVGRGGWTWYTGSASWMYQAGVEAILGLHLRADVLVVDPCIPQGWPGFEIDVRHRTATYEVHVANPTGVSRGVISVEVDGTPQSPLDGIALLDDGRTHRVTVTMGSHSPRVRPRG